VKQILIILLTFAAFCGFGLLSCQHDKCVARNIECQNNGLCRDGECICVGGYEGDSCTTPINEKFVSLYACVRTELINNTNTVDNDDTLEVRALDDGSLAEITFRSIRDTASFWLATASGSSLVIPSQQVGVATYAGDGSLSGEVLTITLYKSDPLNSIDSKTTYVGYKYED